jgi:hypothetical protein
MVSITVDTIRRVRTLLGKDLLSIIDGDLYPQVVSDPVILVDLLFAICKPQADQLGVSDEVFGAGFSGEVLDRATEAFVEALVDFFPPKRASLLRAMVEKMTSLEDLALAQGRGKIDQVTLGDVLEKQSTPQQGSVG